MTDAPPRSVPAVPEAGDRDATVVWHRRHLRVPDQPAVARATETAETVCPLFVFDPHFYGADALACDARRRFLHESLEDLDDQYRDRGTRLVYAHADPLDVVRPFLAAGWEVLAVRTASARYGRERDARAREAGVEFLECGGVRFDAEDPRDGWREHLEAYLTGEPHRPTESTFGDHDVESATSVEEVESGYRTTVEKESVPVGGREPALARMERFLDRIHEYPGSISAPSDARTGTSRLSPYLRFGCLSVREVHRRLERDAPDGDGKSFFRDRLAWNRHYTQKLADWPGWTRRAVNPVFRGWNRSTRDEELLDAWREGRTGFPMVDASMRCLRETGWLNFRMRALCASVLGYVLRQPWKPGADWFYRHLIDADPAINYTQWQYQTGMTGVHAVRVYDPRKAVREDDPEGTFVRRWVPELAPLPTEHLAEPERAPLAVQAECGVEVGDPEEGADYPRPVVDFEARAAEARERYDRLADRAREAASDPVVRRRLSLSERRRDRLDGENGAETSERDGGQTSLDAF